MEENIIGFEKYCDSIRDPQSRNFLTMVLCTSINIVGYMRYRYGFNKQMPEFKIDRNKTSIGGRFSGVDCIINEGVIDHCMKLYAPDPVIKMMCEVYNEDYSKENSIYKDNINDLAKALPIYWIVCHEAFHWFRHHKEVLQHAAEKLNHTNGVTFSSLRRTFEYDADICAAAEQYRFLQNFSLPWVGDLELRKLSIGLIFWGIRNVAEYMPDEEHAPWHQRLYDMALKVAMLWVDQSDGRSYENNINNDTASNLSGIIGMLCDIEISYNILHPENTPDFFNRFLNCIGKASDQIGDWSVVRREVGMASGSNT